MSSLEINGFDCVRISDACPEAYDVMRNGEYVGRLRLRYGQFVARNAADELVYRVITDSDGIFADDQERMACLRLGIRALAHDRSEHSQ